MMKALSIEKYHPDLETAIKGIKIVEKPIPVPGPGEVLVKMEFAPCNPSDLLFLTGSYGVKKTVPAVPGWEGAGTVVAAGPGILNRYLIGKRVATGGQEDKDGTWAEYFTTDYKRCIPLKKTISSEQGSCLIINPLTAIGLFEEVKKARSQAFIQNAAASQVGKMLIALAKKEGIFSINIVRRHEQVEELKSLGADCVLVSTDPDFENTFAKVSHEKKAAVAIDALGGEATGSLLNALAPYGQVYVYGSLTGKPCNGISPFGLIFKEKQVKGFWLSRFLSSKGLLGMLSLTKEAQKLMESGVIHTQIRGTYGFDAFPQALLDYHNKMTLGKVLLEPLKGI